MAASVVANDEGGAASHEAGIDGMFGFSAASVQPFIDGFCFIRTYGGRPGYR